MSKVTSAGKITGAVGPIYYRSLNGKLILQTKPGKGNVKKSSATLRNASEFGRLSASGKKIRVGLLPVLMGWQDCQITTRFNSRLYDVMRTDHSSIPGKRHIAAGDLSLLSGFECNTASLFKDYCNLSTLIEITGSHDVSISVGIPFSGLPVKSLESTDGCELCVFVAAFDAKTLNILASQYMFRCNVAAIGTEGIRWIAPNLPVGSIALVATSLLYYRTDPILGKIYANYKGFHPCRISGVMLAAPH